MSWKKLALVAALSGSTIGVVGCGGDGPDMEPVTVAYVVSTADIPAPVGTTVVGFNLDGVVSPAGGTTCDTVEDWTSPTNGDGVDNQFHGVGGFIETMLEDGIAGAIEEQIAAGTFLLVMEVEDVDSFTADEDVTVNLFLAEVAGGTVAVGASGITADQMFSSMQDIGSVSGTISAGRLLVTGVELPLRLAVEGETIELDLHSASISANISAAGLSNGEIGAYVLIDDIVTVAMGFLPSANRELVESFAAPDIKVDGAATCDGVSLGLSFAAVSALTDATEM